MSATGPLSGADDLPEPGEVVGGRYRIEQVLGSGATGVVYEASHDLTGQRVAIKWLRPDLAASDALTARFLREARAACAIDHPNVVTVWDAGRDRGSLFLVMELLRGESLSGFLLRGPHEPETVVATLMPALRGVAAAHEMGIVHRDLKPDNVFLSEARRGWPAAAKVLDFGISKLKQPVDGRELTHSGVFLGSPLYMAPEQILEPGGVDARADVYSIGVMLYEALSGHVPFEADALHELFRKVMTETPRSLRQDRPEISEELERIVLRAMARDRRSRPESVRALALELEPFAPGVRFDDAAPVTAREVRASTTPLEGGRTEIARGPFSDTGRDLEPPSVPPEPTTIPPAASDFGATRVEIPLEMSGRFGVPVTGATQLAALERLLAHVPPPLARVEVLGLALAGALLATLVLGCVIGMIVG